MSKSATIGHNKPPTEREILLGRLSDEESSIRKEMIFPKPPETIADEQHAGRVTDAIKSVRNLIGTVAETHKAVKAPYSVLTRARSVC